MEDVAHDAVLNVSERGDRAYIGKFEGKDLTHPWAGNVVDLCPVGALLSKDFLNKARSWELDRTASVCNGCSQGCNMIVETRDNAVVRLRPRPNNQVNDFYLCDHGRLNYRWMNRGDRLEAPTVLGSSGQRATDWDVALSSAAAVLKGKRVFVLASPNLSNEALHFLSRIVKVSGGKGAFRMPTGPEAPLPGVKDLALRSDRAANGRGAEMMGFERSDTPLAGVSQGDAVIVVDQDLTPDDVTALSRASDVVLVSTFMPGALARADVVLPIANYVEEEGTLTNLRGHVQRFLQARAAPGMARPSWYVLADLCNALGDRQDALTAAQAFAAAAAAQPAFAGMSYDGLGLRGRTIDGVAAGQASPGAAP
jgi:NADH-quinone oxidoreductase subunit G